MRTPRYRRDRRGGATYRAKIADSAAAAARFCGSDRAATEQVLRDLLAAQRTHGISGVLDGIHAYLATIAAAATPPSVPDVEDRHARACRELQAWVGVICDREGSRTSGMVLAGLAHGVGMAADVYREWERAGRPPGIEL